MASAHRRAWIGVSIACILTLIAACGTSSEQHHSVATGSWKAVVKAARDEGTVVMYTDYLQNQQEAFRKAFNKEYPDIHLKMVRVLSDIGSKLKAEQRTGSAGADVAVTNNPALADRFSSNDSLLSPRGPHAELWKGNKYYFDNTYFTSTFNALGLAWNTNLVKTTIDSYNDLLRPNLKGRFGLITSSGAPVLADFYMFLKDTSKEGMLKQLADHNPRFYSSAVPLQQAVISGEIAAAGYAVPSVRNERKNGAPISFALPSPAWAAPFYAFGVKWAKHPNAALVLLDFMMSRKGQEALAVNGASALPDVQGLTTLDHLRPSHVAKLTKQQVGEFNDQWHQIFGR